jgi:hypothetical protein
VAKTITETIQFFPKALTTKVPISDPEMHIPPLIRKISEISTSEEIPAIEPTSLISGPKCVSGSKRRTTTMEKIPPMKLDSKDSR